MTKKQQQEQDRAEALAELHKLLKPGSTVYTVLRHVSASGMSRRIDLYTIKDGENVCISGYTSRVTGYKRHPRHDGLVVGGCGMDMGFALVYDLGRHMWPKGYIPADAGETRGRNGSDPKEMDNDGGYALKQRWM